MSQINALPTLFKCALLSCLLVGLTGCLQEDATFSQTGSDAPADINDEAQVADPDSDIPPNIDIPDVKDPDEILKNCEDAQAKGYMEAPMTVTIVFADTRQESGRSQVCEFNKNGNIGMINDFLTARYEQVQQLQLPQGADLCDLEFSMDIQQLKYDDIFYLTLNDRVLASNHRASVEQLEVESIDLPGGAEVPLYNYAWGNLVEFPFNNGNLHDYCFGQSEGFANCMWPETQKTGDFQIEYDHDLLIHMGAKSRDHNHQLKFVVTGDNDPSSDCYHEKFQFVLKATYYIR